LSAEKAALIFNVLHPKPDTETWSREPLLGSTSGLIPPELDQPGISIHLNMPGLTMVQSLGNFIASISCSSCCGINPISIVHSRTFPQDVNPTIARGLKL